MEIKITINRLQKETIYEPLEFILWALTIYVASARDEIYEGSEFWLRALAEYYTMEITVCTTGKNNLVDEELSGTRERSISKYTLGCWIARNVN